MTTNDISATAGMRVTSSQRLLTQHATLPLTHLQVWRLWDEKFVSGIARRSPATRRGSGRGFGLNFLEKGDRTQ
ncbi:MAG: hypothetical protein HXY43_24100 [Fischerella sp.]|uniref:hypothetical protein n=1 Tax=Fischerella sp. TaxID=1191 RepID=UPI00184D56D1|nr:hypothetical protein [Fischerella sp.]NWF62247.1 hypothetical protein [Fischerella sp.]